MAEKRQKTYNFHSVWQEEFFFLRLSKKSVCVSFAGRLLRRQSGTMWQDTSNKKAFLDGEVFKEAMMIVANTVFKDEKHGPEVISALSDVQLGASTMARRVSSMSKNLTEQLDRDLATCRWFSIQCDESVDSLSTAQLMILIQIVFDDFVTKEELLTLLPL
ncbi:general transcription factor II-I repeat domain-containing protein 2A-like [Tachysurus ichikawai]